MPFGGCCKQWTYVFNIRFFIIVINYRVAEREMNNFVEAVCSYYGNIIFTHMLLNRIFYHCTSVSLMIAIFIYLEPNSKVTDVLK